MAGKLNMIFMAKFCEILKIYSIIKILVNILEEIIVRNYDVDILKGILVNNFFLNKEFLFSL